MKRSSESRLANAVRSASRRFFAQPDDVKQGYAVPVGGHGWIAPGAEANGYAEGTETPPDLKESYSLGAETATGDPVSQPRTELLRAATWRAARSGLTGDLVSPLTGTPLPAADVVAQLVEHVRPALAAAGDLDWVERQVATVMRCGNGAIQQLGWRAEGADDDEVVRRAVDRTVAV